MDDRKQAPSLVDRAWDFLISLKLAIVVLILLAAASIFGTVIEQTPDPAVQGQYQGAALLKALGMFDMYHSWWFLALMVLFTVNLSCCTLDRLPRVINTVKNPRRRLDEAFEKSMALSDRWKKKGTAGEWADRYAALLASSFAAPSREEEGGTVYLYAEKGVVARFGVYITHLSIILVFVGAIIGNVWGFKGYVNIVEGSTINAIQDRGRQEPRLLGFEVRCNRFWVENYPNGQPKEYSSDLSVIDGGREVMKKTIEVNTPLVYKGVWFYQSSYGKSGSGQARVCVRRPDGSEITCLALTANQPVELPGYGTVTGVDHVQDHQGLGPALVVEVRKAGKEPERFHLPQGKADFDRKRGDSVHFLFEGLEEKMYTGLQVAMDPGVNTVWAGCLLMCVGIMVAFFMSHQRVWLRVSPGQDGRVEVAVAGATTRNRLAFQGRFEKIQSDLKGAEGA